MATFRDRLPSRHDALLLFAICAFPVHVWYIVNLLRELPARMYHLNVWDLVGMSAYVLVFALLESVVFWLVLLLVGAILPRRWFGDRLVALGLVFAFLTSGLAMLILCNVQLFGLSANRSALLWFAPYLLCLGLGCFLVRRYKKLEEWLVSFADRLLVLAYLYLGVGVLSVIVVVVRNVGDGA